MTGTAIAQEARAAIKVWLDPVIMQPGKLVHRVSSCRGAGSRQVSPPLVPPAGQNSLMCCWRKLPGRRHQGVAAGAGPEICCVAQHAFQASARHATVSCSLGTLLPVPFPVLRAEMGVTAPHSSMISVATVNSQVGCVVHRQHLQECRLGRDLLLIRHVQSLPDRPDCPTGTGEVSALRGWPALAF